VVSHHFRPEFINRIDDVVVFHPLDRVQLRQIAAIQTAGLRARLEDRDMQLELTEAALDRLAEAGFDPVYGARPLKRAIQTGLENRLAEEILSGRFGPGDRIVVDAGGDGFEFRREPAADSEAA
jgi:ATP-dependent Clp protease ATP-binding subunit ClpB